MHNRYDYLLNLRNASTALLKNECSSAELISESLKRIKQDGEARNLFTCVNEETAKSQAEAYDRLDTTQKQALPLGGIPIVVKDNIHVSGLATTLGTPALHDHIANVDAYAIRSLREAGAIVVGKTHMHELALGVSGYNLAYNQGTTTGIRNARNSLYSAGGSSSGSAAAVAANIVPLAIGTDTAGSIRIPAALNGCVGYRPSVNRYSIEGVSPLTLHRDTLGSFCSNVVDIVKTDTILRPNRQPTQQFKGPITLGVVKEYWDNTHPAVLEACEAALQRIQQQGIRLVDVHLPRSHTLAPTTSVATVIREHLQVFNNYLQTSHTGLSYADILRQISSPDVKSLVSKLIIRQRIPNEAGELQDVEPIYQEAIQHWIPAMLHEHQTVVQQHGLHGFIYPTTKVLAPLANADSNSPQNFEMLANNLLAGSCIGLASMSLPVALSEHSLAVGLALDVLPDQDELLFIIASKVEQSLGFSKGLDTV